MKERNDSYLALNIVRVDVGEVVFRKLKSDGQKNVEWVKNFAVEGLDIENHLSEPCRLGGKRSLTLENSSISPMLSWTTWGCSCLKSPLNSENLVRSYTFLRG